MMHYGLPKLLSASAVVWLAACATSDGGPAGAGGATSTGGVSAGGGRTGSGGIIATGGATASGGSGSGGATGSGGTPSGSGGASPGGRSGTGGGTSTGDSGGAGGTGGATASGGTAGAGGRRGTGGSTASGGTTGSGGSTSSGGRPGSGGAATGGSPATGGATGSGGTTGAGGGTHSGKWQIMPLGDSITGTTCYPKLLSQELISQGHPNFDFIGTVLNNQGCGSAPNVQTEGHGGYLVTYLTTDSPPQGGKGKLSELKTWAAEKPEIVLMEYGTNDAWSSIATQTILDAYSFVVDQFRAQKPDVIFFVAQITPLNPSGCSNCEANVEALNAKIPSWASGKSTAASPIYVVNVWASLPAATYTPSSAYTSDGCHPNPAGSQLMADKWYEGITAQGIP